MGNNSHAFFSVLKKKNIFTDLVGGQFATQCIYLLSSVKDRINAWVFCEYCLSVFIETHCETFTLRSFSLRGTCTFVRILEELRSN